MKRGSLDCGFSLEILARIENRLPFLSLYVVSLAAAARILPRARATPCATRDRATGRAWGRGHAALSKPLHDATHLQLVAHL